MTPSPETTAVAMSGGVDSSVVAAMLVKQGVPVIGVTAMLTDELSRCCAPEDVETARRVAHELGIPHYVVDVSAAFRTVVMDPFADAYLAGETPSPCVVCNREIKFGALAHAAFELGAATLATGHYVRVERTPDGHVRLLRGVDADKDQSYFLARLRPEQLAVSRFPLGDRIKRDVTSDAARWGLACRESRESQELCFVTSGTHGDWIDVRRLDAAGPGDLVDTSGKRLGRHRGIHHYTIGQRKGLGVAVGHPLYVAAIDRDRQEIILGPREDLLSDRLEIREMSWVSGRPREGAFDALVQIRYRHRPARARVTPIGEDRFSVVFDEAQWAIAPGQLAALYDGDEVLGGGWIGGRGALVH